MQIRVEVTFPKELKEEPLICNLCKQFDIVLNIIEASFSTDIGWAILVMHGEQKEIQKALIFLGEKGADYKQQ